MASQKGLGKGLGALLGDFGDEPVENSAYKMLPVYKVEPNPDQPRQDFDEEELAGLAESITEHGIIQPIMVGTDSSILLNAACTPSKLSPLNCPLAIFQV